MKFIRILIKKNNTKDEPSQPELTRVFVTLIVRPRYPHRKQIKKYHEVQFLFKVDDEVKVK